MAPRKQASGQDDLLQLPEDRSDPTENVVIELSDDDLDIGPAPETVPAEPAVPAAPAEPDALRVALEAQQRAEELARNASRERDEARRMAADRDRDLQTERARGDDARYNSVLTAIAAEQSNLEKAEADLAAAMQAGDGVALSKAARVIGTASSRLDRLQDNKAEIDQQRETVRTNPPPQQRQPTDTASRIATMDLPETAKTWLKAHPEFVTDDSRVRKLNAAHNAITELQNIPQFTPAYFEALDEQMGFKAAAAAAAPAKPNPPPAQRRSVPVSAPVSREPPTASGQRQSSQITLTPEERQVARNSFGAVNGKELTIAEKERLYALNKAKYEKMLANGQYSDARHQR